MSIRRGTVHSIQFLRFVAASIVTIFHTHLTMATHLPGGMPPEEAYLFGFGAVGVHIFFVISGYIMYLTNFGRSQTFSARRFFTRRLIRIYPVYWIFVAIVLAVEAVMVIPRTLSTEQFVGMLALWPGDAARVIGQAWTLAYEIYFYLAFGLVMMLGARRGTWLLTVGFCASIAVGVVLRPTHEPTALATNALLLEFLAGVWIARITSTVTLPRVLGWLGLVGGLLGFAIGLIVGYRLVPSALSWGVPSALLIAGAVILEQTARPSETRGPIRRLSVLGDSSYSLYLCHIILGAIAAAILNWFGVVPSRWLSVTAVTLFCIGFAHAFHLLVERRVVEGLHRLTEGRRGSARPPAAAPVAASSPTAAPAGGRGELPAVADG